MRPRYEGPTLAERLNNALGELHAMKLEHQKQKEQLMEELEQAKEEIQRLRAKNKELKRQQRETIREGEVPEGNHENQHTVFKIKNYLQRIQESTRQMTQVAAECKIVDADIERAASQIQKNISKSRNGLEKNITELVRRWGAGEAMRLENQRFQVENRHLFQLTTSLQQNFRETDRLIKQWSQNSSDQGLKEKLCEVQAQNARLKISMNALSGPKSPKRNDVVIELEQKIARLTEKLKSAEQQNLTIKNIHQRTMKKLQKLQERADSGNAEGQGILQQQRQKWLEKTEELYEQVRRLTKQLMLSEESEKKVREQLSNCLQIYGQWEQEREEKRIEMDELKLGIETYMHKIEQLQTILSEKSNEIENLQERYEGSEGEKEKIVSVYQLQVQELTDQLFKKQDIITEMETIVNRQHYKHQQLKKQFTQLTKLQQATQQKCRKLQIQISEFKQLIKQKQDTILCLEEVIKTKEQEFNSYRKSAGAEKKRLQEEIEKINEEKAEIMEIMEQFKDEYYSVKKDLTKALEQIQTNKDEDMAVCEELRNTIGVTAKNANKWELIASVRSKYKAASEDLKTVREAQIRLIQQTESKEKEYGEALEEEKQVRIRLEREAQSEKKNNLAELKIWKMRVLESELSDEEAVGKAKSLGELLQLVYTSKKGIRVVGIESSGTQDQVVELKQKIIQKDDALERACQFIKSNEKKIAVLQEQKNIQKKLRQELEGMVSHHEQLLKTEAEKIEELNAKIEEKWEQMKELKQTLARLKIELQKRDNEMEELTDQLQRKRSEAEQFQEEKKNIQQKLDFAKTLFEKNEEQQRLLTQQQQEIRQYKEKLKQNQKNEQNINELNGCVQELRLENKNLKENQQTVIELKGKVVHLQNQNQNYLKQINHLLAETEAAGTENSNLLLQLKQLKEQKDLLTELKDSLTAKYEEAMGLLSNSQAEIQKMKEALSKFDEEKIVLESLKRQLEEKEFRESEQKRVAKDEMMSNGYQIIKLTLQLQEKSNLIEEIQSQLQQLTVQLTKKDLKISELTNFAQQCEKKIKEMQNQADSNSEIQNQIKFREESIRQKEIQLVQKQQQLGQISEQLNLKEKGLTVREAELAGKIEKIIEQEHTLMKKTEELEDGVDLPDHYKLVIPDQSQLGLQSTKQSKALDSEKGQLEQLREQLKINKSVIEEKDQQIKERNSQLDDIIMNFKSVSDKLAASEREREELESQIQDYKEQSKILREHLKSSLQKEKEVDILQKKIESLSEQLRQSELMISELNQERQSAVEDQLRKANQQKDQTIIELGEIMKVQEMQLTEMRLRDDAKEQEINDKLERLFDLQNQNSEMERQLKKLREESTTVNKQIIQTVKEKEAYAERLAQIQQLMEQFKKDDLVSSQLREQLDEAVKTREYFKRQSEQTTKQLQIVRQQLSEFSKLGKDPQFIEQSLIKLKRLEGERFESQKAVKQLQGTVRQLNMKLVNSQKLIQKLRSQIQSKEKDLESTQQETFKLLSDLNQREKNEEEIALLEDKISALESECNELREEVSSKERKIEQLKSKYQTNESQKESMQQQLKEKCRQFEMFKKESEHYKAEIKRINKEKVLAESEAAKYRYNLEEQQSMSKLRESQMSQMSETVKSNHQSDHQLINELRTQISVLKQSNEMLKKQIELQMKKNMAKGSNEYKKDLPLQVTSTLKRSSIQSNIYEFGQQEFDKYRSKIEEENKLLKNQIAKNDTISSRLFEAERSNSTLNGELSMLKGELKTKSMTIESLEKQFKSKTEDYSKLQRKVESLSDELNLQKKRVKNFEQLYQSIQSKRLKLANTKNEE